MTMIHLADAESVAAEFDDSAIILSVDRADTGMSVYLDLDQAEAFAAVFQEAIRAAQRDRSARGRAVVPQLVRRLQFRTVHSPPIG